LDDFIFGPSAVKRDPSLDGRGGESFHGRGILYELLQGMKKIYFVTTGRSMKVGALFV
jgi:hypothetical protein